MKNNQKRIVDGKVEYFWYTPEMDKIVLKNYKTKSNREICEILKAKWPYWNFSPISMRSVFKRLNIKRTRKQTYAIILRDSASEFGRKRTEKAAATLTKHKIGEVFFCSTEPYKGRLVIKIDRKKLRYYENYIYDKFIGKVPRNSYVELIDPYGPIVPDNLRLVKREWTWVIENTRNLGDSFVLNTLTKHLRTKEEKEEFKKGPLAPMLIEAQRLYIQAKRDIKAIKDGKRIPNTPD